MELRIQKMKYLINVADHVESNLRQMIVLALKDLLEPGDGLFDGNQLAGVVGENLSDLGDIKLKINLKFGDGDEPNLYRVKK